MTTPTPLNKVPKFTLSNEFDIMHPIGPNGYNKWRKMCKTKDDITIDISNTLLPWMSLYKDYKDLLKIDLVTTVGYVENLNDSKKEAKFIRGFPLILQGPESQFIDGTSSLNSNYWENEWTFYKSNLVDFSGNLQETTSDISNNWLNQGDNSLVITDFDDDQRRNLLILDLSDNFYLHDPGGNPGAVQKKINDTQLTNVNNKQRPNNLVVRLDEAIEESPFVMNDTHGLVTTNPNFWQSSNDDGNKPKLYVFNYVYSGYVISPYDFMANFTTDYLRGLRNNTNSLEKNFLINRDEPPFPGISTVRPIQPTIQLIKNGGTIDEFIGFNNGPPKPNKIIQDGDTLKNHNKILAPFRYNFHIYPTALEITGLSIPGVTTLNAITDSNVNNSNIGGPGTSNIFDVDKRMNTIMSKLENNLYSRAPTGIETWNYFIENIIWCSLSSERHTLYAAAKKNENLYVGNYLNVNELNYNESGVLDPLSQNPDYMPIFKKASGAIIRRRELSASGPLSFSGINEIHMPRKTLTPYYKVDVSNYQQYGFNWSDTTKSFAEGGEFNGIDTSTEKIDVTNSTTVEFRNLVRFTSEMWIQYHFDNNKKTTFITSLNPSTDVWKFSQGANTVILDNNDIIPIDPSDQTTPLTNENSLRKLTNGLGNEYFRIKWDSTDLSPNSSKYGYLIDIASGRHTVGITNITSLNGIDPFTKNSIMKDEKEKFKIISNIYQIKIDNVETTTTTETINVNGNGILNFARNNTGTTIAIYKVPSSIVTVGTNLLETLPFFGYLNFTGIRNSQFLGNTANNSNALSSNSFFALVSLLEKSPNDKNVKARNPYFEINSDTKFNFKPPYNGRTSAGVSPSGFDCFKMFYNPNMFFTRTNFNYSNVYIDTNESGNENDYDESEILFINESVNIKWRKPDLLALNPPQTYNNGLEITNISSTQLGDSIGIKFYVYPTESQLFIPTLLGKVSRDNRVFSSGSEIETPSIELNENLILSVIDINTNATNNINFNCFKFSNINFCAGQGNKFIADFWKWSSNLVDSSQPESSYDGPPTSLVNRNLDNRYNVYNWNISPLDIQVDNNIYTGNNVHNPQFALENQSLIHFIIQVSTITTNFSHILLNTWRGSKTVNNKFLSVGLASKANENGVYQTFNNPIMKINIQGGNEITPNIQSVPVLLDVNPLAKFNFATDSGIESSGNSKAPSQVPEGGQTLPIDFTSDVFGKEETNGDRGGWFEKTDITQIRNGIFKNSGGTITTGYETRDFSANVIGASPSNLILKDSNGNLISGNFSVDGQEFPFELLFCYPIEDLPSSITRPNGLVTSYNNSNGEQSNISFTDYKGYKRFSNLYAISLKGSDFTDNNGNIVSNENFEGRDVFPTNIIINCVELPPPVQVNNAFDMVADDNKSVKIVWKGYNFSKPQGDFRSQFGDSGDIVWKIERFQTQLEIRKTLLEKIIVPDPQTHTALGNNYNLSTYTFTDTDVRIYDKYIYTISGTFVYKFLRSSVDLNSTTLSLSFGSFTTPEVIICKNNKFEYGRYNTTSTNLKLFRPLLINKAGGQKDANGNQSAGGLCLGNLFAGSTNISSSQNIYANTSNQLTKKQIYVLLSKQQYRPFR